jgi:hypothetical protein
MQIYIYANTLDETVKKVPDILESIFRMKNADKYTYKILISNANKLRRRYKYHNNNKCSKKHHIV